MNVYDMSYDDFLKLPIRDWSAENTCDTIIVLPCKIGKISKLKYDIRKFLSSKFPIFKKPEEYEIDGMHDSGYRMMYFVAVNDKNEPMCLISGNSDVLHFDGIGGFGYDWLTKYGKCPSSISPSAWSFDCLPKSGLIRIFCNRKILCGASLSSFEIYAK